MIYNIKIFKHLSNKEDHVSLDLYIDDTFILDINKYLIK